MKRCPYFQACGGCQLQNQPYSQQVALKEKQVADLFPKDPRDPMMVMENPTHYRHKVILSFGTTKEGRLTGGIYAEHSHKIVPIEECLIQCELANQMEQFFLHTVQKMHYRAYDPVKRTGDLRHLLLRINADQTEALAILVLGTPILPGSKKLLAIFRKQFPQLKSFSINVNPRRTPVVLGDKEKVLFGNGTIEDVRCGVHYRLSGRSFFQVNPQQSERLYQKAIELAGLTGQETILDTYCGIGALTLMVAPHVKEALGVEISESAVKDAIANAKRNGIQNASFYLKDASDFMEDFHRMNKTMDVLFMDPPRSGVDVRFMKAVLQLAPKKIVYISCEPTTQKRDIAQLGNHYRVEKVVPVDLFPLTSHVETVVLLSHQPSTK